MPAQSHASPSPTTRARRAATNFDSYARVYRRHFPSTADAVAALTAEIDRANRMDGAHAGDAYLPLRAALVALAAGGR
jgi:hypothetical protein